MAGVQGGENPGGFQYSWFCNSYQAWRSRRDLVIRQTHRADEKWFVDFCGQAVPIANPKTGEIRQAQIFVGVLGASSYTYAEVVDTQELADWLALMGGPSGSSVVVPRAWFPTIRNRA